MIIIEPIKSEKKEDGYMPPPFRLPENLEWPENKNKVTWQATFQKNPDGMIQLIEIDGFPFEGLPKENSEPEESMESLRKKAEEIDKENGEF